MTTTDNPVNDLRTSIGIPSRWPFRGRGGRRPVPVAGRRGRSCDGGGVDDNGDVAADGLGVGADLVSLGGDFVGRVLVDAAEFETEDGAESELVVVSVVEGDLGGDGQAAQGTSRWATALLTAPMKQ